MPYTYILRCGDNRLYVGSTTNLQERLKRHNAGYASEFTHLHQPVELVYKEAAAAVQSKRPAPQNKGGWTHEETVGTGIGNADGR